MATNTDRIRIALSGLIQSRELIFQMVVELYDAGLADESASLQTDVLLVLDTQILAIQAALAAPTESDEDE